MRFENDGTGRRDVYLRVRVQSEAGVQAWGQLAFPYNSANERMDVVFVRVLKADGTVVTALPDAVQDLSSAVQREAPVYTDTREKHVTVPGLRPGEALELALATLVQTPLARGHFWAEHEFISNGVEQLEIDPLDKYAHKSLGEMYLEQHNYEAALPALEKAIALSPQKAILRVRLGEAFLNLRQPDQARAAFTRAVELDPAPLIWNDIAYRLAQNGTDLELAQRYAESAVAAMTAASRTVSIDHVTVRDLSQIGSMASYWDTLGWVHFANGDLDRAAKLVSAAWGLLQNAEVGDHLAQIYEKQGRREDAIRTYALAMSAERPDPKIRERLAALLGRTDGRDAMAPTTVGQLLHARTIALDVTGPAGAAADFFVLLDNRSGGAAVEGVMFISGDEALRRLGDALPRAKYDATFPDTAPAKVLRRGTLSCAGADRSASCRFTLMLPADAQAAQQENDNGAR